MRLVSPSEWLGQPAVWKLAGLSVDYMTVNCRFQNGRSSSSVGITIMTNISRALTPQESGCGAEVFSRLGQRPWVKVVETDMVPKTVIVEGGLRINREPQELEPLGDRIIEVPMDTERSRLNDSRASFIAYVPKGSIARGKSFVCQPEEGRQLYGVSWQGVARGRARSAEHPSVPSLRGRSPTYLVRQLYDFHSGARSGPGAELMKPVALQLTLREMTDVAAYIASLVP
jgi:hypothetical protein